MKHCLSPVLMVLFLGSYGQQLEAQSYSEKSTLIPAYTAYIHPAEKTAEVNVQGIVNWRDLSEEIQFNFYVRTPGELELALNLITEGCRLQIFFAGQTKELKMDGEKGVQKVNFGTTQIPEPGFQKVIIRALEKKGLEVAQVNSLELTGSATKELHFNSKERRNSASVHLSYPVSDKIQVEWFYNEILVPAGMDPLYTYYMACGFNRGYFGIQVNSEVERRIIFSVWDSGDEAYSRDKVPDSLRVKLVGKGKGVYSGDFGNEGTGGHSHLKYDWATGKLYQFLVHAEPAGSYTVYSGYFKTAEETDWMLVSSWKAPRDGYYLTGLYSFVENFWGTNGDLTRKAWFPNQWVCSKEGKWTELTQARFSYDATGHARDRIDFAAGIEDGKFYLLNGGFFTAGIRYGDVFNRAAKSGKPPVILPLQIR